MQFRDYIESAHIDIKGMKSVTESRFQKIESTPEMGQFADDDPLPGNFTVSNENSAGLSRYVPDDLNMPVIYHRQGEDVKKLEASIKNLIDNAPEMEKKIPNFSCTPDLILQN